jgi:signal transduction histidine kinase
MIQALAHGADDFVSKSSDVELMKARIQAQIRRKRFEDEGRHVREQLLRREIEASTERTARQLAEAKAAMVEELERKNQELEAFSYSVSHDLRSPLRGIDGFSAALEEDFGDVLEPEAREHLARIRSSVQRMNELIEDLLKLSRVGRGELVRAPVSVEALARRVGEDLARRDPQRRVTLTVAAALEAEADRALVQVLLENLIGNAWKFTAKTDDARIEVGRRADGAFFVRDNGVGFDMDHAGRLFRPFQRLHRESEFPGTGIGLATVYRIVDRHGGRVGAESAVGHGTTVWFTLPPEE